MVEDFIAKARRYLAGVTPKTAVVVVVAIMSLLLYAVGIKFVLFPMMTVLVFVYLPLPRVLGSAFGRVFTSLFLSFSLLPVAGAIQYLLLSRLEHSFLQTAIIFTALHAGLLLYAPARKTSGAGPKITSADACALLVGGMFILPFLVILLGGGTFAGILQLAGFQVVDAGHHYSFLNYYGQVQFLGLGYYPAGFHYSVAFLQEGVFGQLFDAGWRTNALLYFSHYMFLGVALAYIAYHFSLSLFLSFKPKAQALRPGVRNLLLALCLGPALVLFYVLPLFAHGFLNYFYVIIALLLGFIFLVEIRDAADTTVRRWGVLVYLLLAYSAVSSWSLFIPLTMLVGVIYFLPLRLSIGTIWREATALRNLPIIFLFVLQLVLVYFQATTVQLGSREGFNATGNLHQLHYLVLLAGFALVVALALSKKVDDRLKKVMYGIFVPAFLLVTCISLTQYFQTGEIRYFAVKIGLFVEIMSLALAVAALLYAYVESKVFDLRFMLCLPLIPLIGMTMLFGSLDSPLREMREIFKPYSGIDKPQYYAHDARLFVELGSKGKMQNFNAISLHYIKEIPKIDGYMQLSYRANLFRYDQTTSSISAVYSANSGQKAFDLRACNDKVYAIIEYGTASAEEQQKVVDTLRQCARAADDRGLDYYIVTDEISAPHLKEIFGDVAQVVY